MNHAFFFAVVFLGLSVHSIVGLVTIWAGLGRPHWFVRLAVLGGVLSLGLAISAHDLILLFALQAAVAIVPLWLIRRRGSRIGKAGDGADSEIRLPRRTRPQFSLLDLLLVTVVVAAIVAFAVRVPGDVLIDWISMPVTMNLIPIDAYMPGNSWSNFILMPAAEWIILGVIGLGLGLSTLAAAWFGLGVDRWRRRCAAVCLVPTSIPMAVWIAALREAGWTRREPGASSPLCRWASKTPRRSRLFRIGGHLTVLVIGTLWLLPTGAAFLAMLHTLPIPQTELPSPNGYDELIEAAGRVGSVWGPDIASTTQSEFHDLLPELRDFLAEHKETLVVTRAAIGRESAVPYPSTWAHYNEQIGRVPSNRKLARILRLEGRVAEAEDRHEDAADSYLDCVRLASTVSRGGLITHWLVGIAIEGMGFSGLSGLRNKLPADRMRRLIETLQSFDTSREPLTDIYCRYAIFDWNTGNWHTRLQQMFEPPGTVKSQCDFILRRDQAQMRLLICDLAIRTYRAEQGTNPEELADLVPDYLSAVPEDPFSGKPLLYRQTQTGYLLYSVGQNGVDDSGQPAPVEPSGYQDHTSGDLLLDPPTENPKMQ